MAKLVIDDSKLICSIVEKVFEEDEDIIVDKAYSGDTGIQKAIELLPDLILLDLVILPMDGFEIFRQLKLDERTKNTPVIFITGNNDANTIVKCFEMGAVDYIAKPFIPVELRARVKSRLEFQNMQNELKKAMVELKHIANNDFLTGLHNRRYFIKCAKELIDKKIKADADQDQTKDIYLAIFDIDNFKIINDTYGHAGGDYVLVIVSDIFKSVSRDKAVCSRWGGEEFILVAVDMSLEDGYRLVEEIRTRVGTYPFFFHGVSFQVTITCGLSKYYLEDSIERNITHVDKALYEGKEKGKNRTVIYNPHKKMM